jgi:hypothetical protein
MDALLVLPVAATTYSTLRDRSHWLAALALAGFVANAVIAGVTDVVGIVATFVADEFVNGGPGVLAPGDPSVLTVGSLILFVGLGARLVTHAGFAART